MKSQSAICLISGLVTFLFLSACDPGVHHKKIIENHSDYDVSVIIDKNSVGFGYETDSFLVGRHSYIDFFEVSHLGGNKKYSDCSTFTDSIRTHVIGNDNLHVTLDLNNRSNWTFYSLKEGISGNRCECRIRIRNEDIQ